MCRSEAGGSVGRACVTRRTVLVRLASAVAAAFTAPTSGLAATGSAAGDSAAAMRHPRLLRAAHALLAARGADDIARFLRDWPDTSARRDVVPAALPVLKYLGPAVAAAPRAARPLVRELRAAASSLRWRQTYAPAQVGERFLENYGWAELLGLTGEVPSERLAVGFLLLGPDTSYPRHAHPAEEIYVPLSGTAQWWTEATDWHPVAPLVPVPHAGDEAHAMRTGTEPLLALYLWHGPYLREKSRLV